MSNTKQNTYTFKHYVRPVRGAIELQKQQFNLDIAVSRYTEDKVKLIKLACVVLLLSAEQAVKLVETYFDDVSEALKDERLEQKATIKAGNVKKSGTIDLQEILKVKGTMATPAMRIVNALQWAEKCSKYGWSYGGSDFVPNEMMVEWLRQVGIKMEPYFVGNEQVETKESE